MRVMIISIALALGGLLLTSGANAETIDFEGLPAGTILNEVFGDGGSGPILVRGINPSNKVFDPSLNAAIVFDSANPSGFDFDLGTPNEDFGGPGIGNGGKSGEPFENNTPLRKLLIVAEDLVDANNDDLVDDPDHADVDDERFNFDFSALGTVTMRSIDVLDVDDSEGLAKVTLFDTTGAIIGMFEIPRLGNNGAVYNFPLDPPMGMGIGTPGVQKMEVMLNGSGAIDNIVFERAPAPTIEICTLVTLNPDMLSDFSDADAIVGDGCDTFEQAIPVGVAGTVDGTYMLKVTNTGTETLVNVRINAPDFGLVDEPIPAACGDLDPGDMCIIDFDDPNPAYSSLKILDVCTAPGQVTNIATAKGDGQTSGIPVSDDDPVTVECVVEPHITLRKEVSLDGGPFKDANTAATGPSGQLGDDAEYRITVTNDGTETLVGAVINDEMLGLVNVPVPGGPLEQGDTRVITIGDFPELLFEERCDSVGEHLNIAVVNATGMSGVPVRDEDPAWVNCENPRIELLKQVSINGGAFVDADTAGTAPIGIVGFTDATYRLIVTNLGTETLEDVLIEDATLGVSANIDELAPGESRIIESVDAGFGDLFQQMRCEGTPGNKSNIATVNATGANTGTQVSDDDPANVRCIEGPAILLLKQVSLDGVNFVDADTAATGPTGLLGADATYRMIVRNVGGEDLINITIDDHTLGIAAGTVVDLAIGNEVVLDFGSFGGALLFENRCDAVGTKLNTAEVNAIGVLSDILVQDEDSAYVNCEALAVCNVVVDKTCLVAPAPNDDLMCTNAISATTLRYTGPSLTGATVTFAGKENGFAEYTSVDLDSNTTILTMAGQNGFTIDAGVGVKLGAKMTITINGVEEIIHTSCSAIYVAGQPAPLDNPKGDPSPNWSVVNFAQKDGVFIEELIGGGQQGADACTVPFGGADVTYDYKVTNTGTTGVDVTMVLDDLLGEQLTSPPALLGAGDSLMLSSGPVFIDQDTTNVVDVSANVSGDLSATCMATDMVAVTVEPPPVLSCADGKPVELVFEYTGFGCEANPANPQGGKFTCSGDPAGADPVQLVVEAANANPSTESLGIGDFVTITPLGGKFDAQTDFEIKQVGQVLQNLSMHLSCSQDINVGDQFGALTLRVFVPATNGDGKKKGKKKEKKKEKKKGKKK